MVTAKEMGKKGGEAKSEAKAKAARKNASKPRARWVTWAHFAVIGADGKRHDGHLLWLKNFDVDFERNGEELHKAMSDFFLERGQKHVLPIRETVAFASSGRKLHGWRLPSIAECLGR